MSKIMLMTDDDNNDYGSIIKSTLIKKTISYWKTGMCLYAEEKLTGTDDTDTMWNMSRRLTQLLFSISLCPSWKEYTPKKEKKGDFFYMYNLKLISKTEEELKKQMPTVGTFSDDSHMEFRLDKCTNTLLKNGKISSFKKFND